MNINMNCFIGCKLTSSYEESNSSIVIVFIDCGRISQPKLSFDLGLGLINPLTGYDEMKLPNQNTLNRILFNWGVYMNFFIMLELK